MDFLLILKLPVFCLMPSLFCNRSKELLRLKWGISGSSLRKFCRSNFSELAKKILVSFTFGLARQIFGFPRFSTITFLSCNCLGPRNTRWISTIAAKILFCWKKPENRNKFHISWSLSGPGPFEGVSLEKWSLPFLNFLSNRSISYESWDVQLTFDTLIYPFRVKL